MTFLIPLFQRLSYYIPVFALSLVFVLLTPDLTDFDFGTGLEDALIFFMAYLDTRLFSSPISSKTGNSLIAILGISPMLRFELTKLFAR